MMMRRTAAAAAATSLQLTGEICINHLPIKTSKN